MKYLLLLVIVFVLWWAWKKRSDHPHPLKETAPKAAENIVACAHCGVLHPLSESLIAGGVHYCCAAHRSVGKSSGADD